MTTPPPILRNCLLAVPVSVGLGAAFGEATALAAAAAAVLMVVNIGAMSFVGSRFVASLARSEGGGLWGPLLIMKTGLMLTVVVELMEALSPLGVGLGLSTLLFGALFTGLSATPHEV
jgi:hypothetical protein